MSKFQDLPEDLANVVCDFAYCQPYYNVYYSMKWYLHIKCYRLPKHLCKRTMYSPKYRRVLPNPLFVFEPIQNFGSYRDLFDWDTIYMMLWQLDFRRSIVRSLGNRGNWHLKFALDWKHLLKFILYYRTLMIMPRGIIIYKPSLQPFLIKNGKGVHPLPVQV